MSNKRTEEGFRHDPDPIEGVEARIKQDGQSGDVSVSFGDGSSTLHMDRREFLRVSAVAATTAAMAGTACRNPKEKIVPYVDRPAEVRIGMPNFYATVCTSCQANCGALVQTRGGRPVKLEGNPQHPISKGALCARGQAHHRDLYDPDRARTPLEVNPSGAHREMKWEELDAAVLPALQGARGIALLTGPVSGSARRTLFAEIGRAVPFTHYAHQPLASDALLAASASAYGAPHVPHYHFDRADLIVSLGSDFLGTWLSPVEFTKQWASRRDPEKPDMARLVAFESHLTVTGMNADDCYRVRPSDLHLIALALAHVVLVTSKTGPLARSSAVVGAVGPFTVEAVSERTGVPASVLSAIGAQLAAKAGSSLVVAGGLASSSADGLALESAVNLLNAALENEGRTVDRARPSQQSTGASPGLAQLVADIEAGKVDVLIVHEANPLYDAPPELKVAEAFKKVKLVISTSDRVDETATVAKYLAPGGHSLETWGDSEPVLGTHSIIQPAIEPLWATRALEQSLIAWFGGSNMVPGLAAFIPAPELAAGNRPGAGLPLDPGAWYRYLRNHWEQVVYPRARSLADFESFWVDTLRRGVFVDDSGAARLPQLRLPNLLAGLSKAMPEARAASKPGDLATKEIQLVATVPLYDGKPANNGHLQELPDPITKHVWGSFIALSPKAFRSAGIEAQGHWIEVTIGGAKKRFQAVMQPGLHDDVVAIPVGYGRTNAGVIGNGVGENAFALSTMHDGRRSLVGLTAEVRKTADGEPISIVQGSQVLDSHRRPILSITTLEEYQADPSAGIGTHPLLPDMWGEHNYELKWGMAIDLSRCTGCSACVTACQEENNIPVVGRRGIIEGREMHWMRIDRYYQLPEEAEELQQSVFNDPMLHTDPLVAFGELLDNPRIVNQPMLCQHCENAPCETVCPVSATMHSTEGLNQMAYNRCVGTRYCSNNCPYKVRRYNWFNYATDRSDSFFSRFYDVVEPGLLNEHAALNTKEPMPMAYNPDVVCVRSRGVMEKCTFCVQRIRRAKMQLKKEARTKVRDGDVIPACQQTCPADAIAFGDLADATSRVAILHAKQRALSPLAEVGVHSSIAYLTSVFNTAAKKGTEGAKDGAHAPDHAADHG